MRHHLLILLLMCCGIVSAAGCNSVTVVEPLGTPASVTEQNQLIGTWMSSADDGGESVVVEVARDKSGTLWCAGLSWDKATDQFTIEKMQLHPTKLGDVGVLYVSTLKPKENSEEKSEKPMRHALCRYEITDEKTVTLSAVDATVFRTGVEQKKLGGQIESPNETFYEVVLDTKAEELAKFIADTGVAKCFPPEPLSVFKRIRRTE